MTETLESIRTLGPPLSTRLESLGPDRHRDEELVEQSYRRTRAGIFQRREGQLSDRGAVGEFLAWVYALSTPENEDMAIDEVIDRFESWLEANDWSACDKVLATADVDKLLPSVSLGILSMTLVEKNRIQASRSAFYQRVRHRLVEEYSEEEAQDNLRGLE